MAKIEEKVENLIEPKIKELGYNLYDVEYVKEGKDYYERNVCTAWDFFRGL